MHFTLWPSLRATEGGHTEIPWTSFLNFVASPQVSADKTSLEGWSPARFAGNRRSRAAAELVSVIVLDDDKTGLPLKRVVDLWRSLSLSGAVHSSHSHTDAAPKWRVILRCSRDMAPDEHARMWTFVRDRALEHGQTIDESTRDPSRLWFVPSRRAGAPYEWAELMGEPLDVDAILAATPADPPPPDVAPAPRASATNAPTDRRKAMALALGAAWPSKGRHDAQLALAGALRGEGWSADEAIDFLCAVCRAAGDEDRPKREATVKHTWSRGADAPLTGWTRLKAHVDGVLVDAARGALGRDADWTERASRRVAELHLPPAAPSPDPAPSPAPDPHHTRTPGGIVFRSSGWDEPLAPPVYIVDSLLVEGSVSLFVAHGNSLKSMTTLSIAIAVATGRPWLGQFVVQQGPVLVLDYERNAYEARRRVKLLRADGVTNLLHATQPTLRTDDPALWEDLFSLRPRLVVADSLAAGAMGTDENERGAALPLQLAQTFAQATKSAVLFVHHARKGTGGDQREAVRGSTAIFAAVDAAFRFDPIDDVAEDGAVKRMRIECIKMNLGREPKPFAIELSDERGLIGYEEPKNEQEDSDRVFEQRVITILKAHPAGVPRETVVQALTGRKTNRRERLNGLIAAMILSDRIVEQKFGKQVTIRLNHNLPG